MAAAVSASVSRGTASHRAGRSPALRSSESDSGVVAHRRLKSRDVPSRYLVATPSSVSSVSTSSSSSWTCSSSSSCSSASARRCPSSLAKKTIVSTPKSVDPRAVKRSQSVERRRTATPGPDVSNSGAKGRVSTAQRTLFTSAKSLSVSFQGEAYSLPVNKAKPSPPPCVTRRGTPERRKQVAMPPTAGRGTNQTENSKQSDTHPWPRSRPQSSTGRSVDYADERKECCGSGNRVVRALQNSVLHNRASSDGRLTLDLANDKKKMDDVGSILTSAVGLKSLEIVASDAESVSSDSTISRKNGVKINASTKLNVKPKKFGAEIPVSSPKGTATNGLMSPMYPSSRPNSPSMLRTPAALNPSRGVSPSRGRKGAVSGLSNNKCISPSILSFAADVRRANVGESQVADAHLLRVLYNTLLQWRFVNARGDTFLSVQGWNAEWTLYNAWITISRLHDSVRAKRAELQALRGNLKLIYILKGQIMYLEEWATIDQDHSASLVGAIEALKASTIRLPVVGGAVAKAQSVKDAICSAVDVMHAMASSVSLLSSKIGEVSSLASELINITAKEHATLDQCKDIMSAVSAMQVKECSLRTNLLQLEQHSQSNGITATTEL